MRILLTGAACFIGTHIAEQARAPFVPVVPVVPASGLREGSEGSSPPESALLPRAMLWSVAVPLLVMAERLGLTRITPDVYEQAASRLDAVSHQCRPSSE